MEREFKSLNQLLDVLRKEALEITRFPARFILIKGLSAWQDFVSILNLEVDELITLSSFCRDKDLLPTISRSNITDRVKKAGITKILLLPLTECLRFSDGDTRSNYLSILRELAQWQHPGKKRIYIPIFESPVSFDQEMDRVPRSRVGELSEVWILKGEGGISVKVIPFGIKSTSYVKINGFKAFLETWEKSGLPCVQLVTQIAPHVQKQTGNYEIQVYKNGFDVISERTNNLQSIPQEWGLKEQWKWLAEQLEEEEDFRGVASRLLNIKTYDEHQLLSFWSILGPQERWVVWLWSKLDSRPGTYFQSAIGNTESYQQLLGAIINGVFGAGLDLENLKERKILLENININNLPDSFWNSFNKVSDPSERLRYLTGITEREKHEAVLCVKELLAGGSDPVIWWNYLEISYPELCFYLRGFAWKEDFLKRYFDIYISSKILDAPREELLIIAHEIAQDGAIWGIPTREGILEKKATGTIPLIWVDGMGLEWVGLLKGIISSHEWVEMEVEVTRANLPSTTAFNKGWEKEENVIRGLDQIAHRYDYSYPQSLVEEMDFINKVAEKAINLLTGGDEVIITSDHGLSRSTFHKGKVTLAPKGATVHKWGRFAELEDGLAYQDLNDSIWLTDGNKIFLAIHGRFEGGSGSTGEIHGGATLEECLVPVIRLTKSAVKTAPSVERLHFKIVDPVVKLDVKGKGHLRIQLTGSAQRLNLITGARSFPGIAEEFDRWDVALDGLKAGPYRGRLEYEGGLLGEITFKVIKGIMEEDMGL